jgi:hypothetical protein
MRQYRNEAAFSKHLCEHLSQCGYLVQRVESHETGRGIPDVYVGVPEHQYWIELKRIKTKKPRAGGFLVPWRPGQQRWMYQHYRITKVPCFTFIAFDDCIVALAHTRLFQKNIAHPHEIMKVWVRVEDVRL